LFMQLVNVAARGDWRVVANVPVEAIGHDFHRLTAEARAHLDDPALVAAWAEGQIMTEEQMVAYALSATEGSS
ncbi:MAG: hypothetical protein M1546_01565, partial [Chloroflexi bacterium]|nr:hypothetical protein [Chloroflexota bacterium]